MTKINSVLLIIVLVLITVMLINYNKPIPSIDYSKEQRQLDSLKKEYITITDSINKLVIKIDNINNKLDSTRLETLKIKEKYEKSNKRINSYNITQLDSVIWAR